MQTRRATVLYISQSWSDADARPHRAPAAANMSRSDADVYFHLVLVIGRAGQMQTGDSKGTQRSARSGHTQQMQMRRFTSLPKQRAQVGQTELLRQPEPVKCSIMASQTPSSSRSDSDAPPPHCFRSSQQQSIRRRRAAPTGPLR